MSIRGFLDNAVEYVFDRPTVARDQILRATSSDGLNFARDEAWRWRRPFTARPHMNYFVTRDRSGNSWRRSSEYDGQAWLGVLYCGDDRIDAALLGAQDIVAPVWCEDQLFAVVRDRLGATYIGAAQWSRGRLTAFAPLVWPGLDALGAIDDLFVLKTGSSYWGWASCGTDERAIHAWTSPDGAHWSSRGVAVMPSSGETIANNPCVLSLADGRYRMYHRASRNPAVGSTIVSAVSSDLTRWTREPGVRLAPGGRWDKHGVAFPAVFQEPGGWLLYYTGYWGDCAAGDRCAQQWLERHDAPPVVPA